MNYYVAYGVTPATAPGTPASLKFISAMGVIAIGQSSDLAVAAENILVSPSKSAMKIWSAPRLARIRLPG